MLYLISIPRVLIASWDLQFPLSTAKLFSYSPRTQNTD